MKWRFWKRDKTHKTPKPIKVPMSMDQTIMIMDGNRPVAHLFLAHLTRDSNTGATAVFEDLSHRLRNGTFHG